MENNEKKILLVDDEPFLLEALAEYLKHCDRDQYSVLTAINGRKALEVLARENVCLVVSDIYMPEISGIHLLSCIKEKYPDTVVILMTAYHSEQIRGKAEKGGCLHFIEKPFEFAHIRNLIVDNITKKDNGFVGTLRNIQLTDLIQMCCLSPISMTISVTKGVLEGTIYIQEGEIIHAVCGDINGEEAFYRILEWGTGSFETRDSSIVPLVSIGKNWQSLLMEAVRRIDEKENETPSLEEEDKNNIRKQKVETDIDLDPDIPIGVLIVDDSAMMFNVLEKMFKTDKHIRVLGRAANGAEALEKIKELSPDLITLDVNMPVMDGGTALKHIMLKNPCPVFIISSVKKDSLNNILEFLRLGAIDFVAKPCAGQNMGRYQRNLIEKVKRLSKAKTENFKRVKNHKILFDKRISEKEAFSCERLVVVKAGYGGYSEIMRIIPELPHMLNTSVLIFQTAPPELILTLSDYLNKRSLSHIFYLNYNENNGKEYRLYGGGCYIVSGNIYLSIEKKNSGCFLKIIPEDNAGESPKSCHFDRCLLSIAKNFFGRIQIVFLSGSEIESLEGIRKIKEKGGRIIAQTPESSVVPFSLQKIISHGIVDIEAEPQKISEIILLKDHE
ncbi:MAG: response regulator [Desulfobacterales bacterium]